MRPKAALPPDSIFDLRADESRAILEAVFEQFGQRFSVDAVWQSELHGCHIRRLSKTDFQVVRGDVFRLVRCALRDANKVSIELIPELFSLPTLPRYFQHFSTKALVCFLFELVGICRENKVSSDRLIDEAQLRFCVDSNANLRVGGVFFESECGAKNSLMRSMAQIFLKLYGSVCSEFELRNGVAPEIGVLLQDLESRYPVPIAPRPNFGDNIVEILSFALNSRIDLAAFYVRLQFVVERIAPRFELSKPLELFEKEQLILEKVLGGPALFQYRQVLMDTPGKPWLSVCGSSLK